MWRLLAIGWSGITNAINEAIEIPEVFDQSAKMNVLNMRCMVVNARAASDGLWQEHFNLKLFESLTLKEETNCSLLVF